MPTGALVGGTIISPDDVGNAVRHLLDYLGASSTEAVIGVPSASTVLRTLTIPPSSGVEMDRLVAGEVEHFGILATEGSTYGTYPMPAAHGTDGGASLSVLLIGAEGREIAALRQMAVRAALEVDSLEPINLAMYRASRPHISDGKSLMVATISDTRTDVVMHVKGDVCLYRRVDLGSNSLLVRHAGDDMFLNPSNLAAPESPGDLDPRKVSPGPANTLAIEFKRSVEYFHREYQGEEIDKLLLVTTEPFMEELVPWLSAQVGLPVEMIQEIRASSESAKVKTELEKPNGAKYLGAYGLALRGLADDKAPSMDLFVKGRTAAAIEEERKGTAWSLLASILLVVLGVVIAFSVGLKANLADHELFHAKADVAEKQAQLQKTSEEDVRVRQQYDLLQASGVPLGNIVDVVSRDLSGPIGLTDIQADSSGKIHLAGEAEDENSVIAAAAQLKAEPIIQTSNVSSMTKVDPESRSVGLNFIIEATGRFGTPPAVAAQ